ncbi:hypothetical protein BH23ACT6_BH23ACT6_04200 [soil metagenome]
MAGKGKAVGAAIKYGPIVYEASRRYGPKMLDQLKAGREPAERYVQAKVDKGNQHKKAVQHASTVIDGSTLQIFHRNAPHWIVFSGDEPIAVHPRTNIGYAELLKNVDLTKRVRPEDEPTPVQRLRAATRKKSPQSNSAGTRSTSSKASRSAPTKHARADVTMRPSTPTDASTAKNRTATGDPSADGSRSAPTGVEDSDAR